MCVVSRKVDGATGNDRGVRKASGVRAARFGCDGPSVGSDVHMRMWLHGEAVVVELISFVRCEIAERESKGEMSEPDEWSHVGK